MTSLPFCILYKATATVFAVFASLFRTLKPLTLQKKRYYTLKNDESLDPFQDFMTPPPPTHTHTPPPCAPFFNNGQVLVPDHCLSILLCKFPVLVFSLFYNFRIKMILSVCLCVLLLAICNAEQSRSFSQTAENRAVVGKNLLKLQGKCSSIFVF